LLEGWKTVVSRSTLADKEGGKVRKPGTTGWHHLDRKGRGEGHRMSNVREKKKGKEGESRSGCAKQQPAGLQT